jgi:type III pantothenate kinase
MYILGDIGNTETKIFLVSFKDKILKKIIFPSKELNQKKLNKFFKTSNINFAKIQKVLFCSVVPKSFNLIKTLTPVGVFFMLQT